LFAGSTESEAKYLVSYKVLLIIVIDALRMLEMQHTVLAV